MCASCYKEICHAFSNSKQFPKQRFLTIKKKQYEIFIEMEKTTSFSGFLKRLEKTVFSTEINTNQKFSS